MCFLSKDSIFSIVAGYIALEIRYFTTPTDVLLFNPSENDNAFLLRKSIYSNSGLSIPWLASPEGLFKGFRHGSLSL